MSRALLGWPIYSDAGVSYAPALSGGSWVAGLPLSNLQDRDLSKVARSTDAALASTIIKADLGVARPVRLAALVNHTLSSAAKSRLRLMAAAPFLDDNDLNAWTSGGTPIVTTGQADPFSGTRGTLLGDDDAGANEFKFKSITFTGNGTKAIGLSAKAGTAGQTAFGIFDQTASAWRHLVRVTWTAGVPALTTEVGLGSGTLYTPVLLSTGYYALRAAVDGVIAANDNRFIVYGAGAIDANTGDTLLYEALAWDLASDPVPYDSAILSAWPSGVDAESYEGYTRAVLHVLSAAVTARYARLELADTANAAGYVQAGRLALCGAWEPTYNFSPGARLGFESSTSVQESDGGARIYRDRASRRVATAAFNDLPKDEALASGLDLQARLGLHKQLVVVLDPDDATHLHRQSFLAVLRELSPLEHPYYHRRHVPLALVEEL